MCQPKTCQHPFSQKKSVDSIFVSPAIRLSRFLQEKRSRPTVSQQTSHVSDWGWEPRASGQVRSELAGNAGHKLMTPHLGQLVRPGLLVTGATGAIKPMNGNLTSPAASLCTALVKAVQVTFFQRHISGRRKIRNCTGNLLCLSQYTKFREYCGVRHSFVQLTLPQDGGRSNREPEAETMAKELSDAGRCTPRGCSHPNSALQKNVSQSAQCFLIQ